MEIGFVKQALNNEIIKMKPLFRRAKVQSINQLTKKSKLFKAKLEKCDEKGVLKFSNKSKELLKEAFIIKKLKARDCAEFVLRNDKNIQHFLNSSEATREKALCRLITHKSLVDKIVFIKEKFLNMPVDVLLAPGKRQVFKEEKEKRKLEKKAKRPQDWTITHSPNSDDKKADDSLQNGDKSVMEMNKPEAEPIVPKSSNSTPAQPKKKPQPKQSKPIPKKLKKKLPELKEEIIPQVSGVDSFFMTNDGDNYKTLVEKRVQEPIPESKVVRGNRQARRAAMFGRPVPFKPTENSSKSSFDKLEKNSKKRDNLPKRFDKATITKKSRQITKGDSTKSIKEDISSLHPSWQAKKQQSVISEFKGKKVVFDDD